MRKLTLVVGLAMALAIALPDSTKAASFSEVKKLVASDAEAGDGVGISVAVSGEFAIAGASHEAAGGENAGAAYLFQRDEGGVGNWGQVKKLTASDAQEGDIFGTSVAISGNTAIVGARLEDEGGNDAGAAYVFQRDEGGIGNWGEVTKLTAFDGEAGDLFGISVAISGNSAVVGAIRADAGASNAGAAYVFQRDAGGANNWGQVKELIASDAEPGDSFGESVAVSGDIAVVGATLEDAGGENAGAAYLFQRDEGGAHNWGQVKKLTASDAEAFDSFGGRFSVAISGDTAVVGADHEDAVGSDAGAAYVFLRDEGGADNWGQVKKLIASDAEAGDNFGKSVSVSGDTILTGAWQEDSLGNNAGAAYIFEHDQGGAGSWVQAKKLTASDGEAFDLFGYTVSVSGDTVVAGAYLEDSEGTNAGAAYIFERGTGPPEPTPTGGLQGDASCDGTVNAIDAALVLQFGAGLVVAVPCPAEADADNDGDVDSVDAALILQFTAGLLGSLPS